MKRTPFLITGCGRSGTRFMANFLTANGVPTGWEATVNPFQPVHKARDFTFILRRLKLAGDANWLAVPYISRILESVQILHQVRDPLKVVRSFLVFRFFGDDYFLRGMWQGDQRHTNLPRYHLPGLAKLPTALERSLFYWVRWNKLCEQLCRERTKRPCLSYRFEDVLSCSAVPLLWRYFAGSSRPLPSPMVWPENPNGIFKEARDTVRNELTWDMIPDGALKDEARELAASYGYEV